MNYIKNKMSLNTPDESTNKKFLAFTGDEKEIEINLSIKDQRILFQSFIDEGIEKKKYSSSYNLESLKQIKLFYLYDSLNEIFSEISNYIETNKQLNKKCTINKNNNILSVVIPTNSNKFKEISFEMKEIEKSVDEKYDNLILIINKLNIKVDKIENENREWKNKVNELEKIVKKIQSENENLIKKIETEKKKNDENKEKDEINPFYESVIVKKEESKMICDWINPNKNSKFKLLYRATRDGDDPSIFHRYCDNKGPTIFFAEYNGYRYGGYTSISWESPNSVEYKRDDKAFVFSINNKRKFVSNHDNIIQEKAHGPAFGSRDLSELWISDKALSRSSCGIIPKYFDFTIKDMINIDSLKQQDYKVKDYEVFSVS